MDRSERERRRWFVCADNAGILSLSSDVARTGLEDVKKHFNRLVLLIKRWLRDLGLCVHHTFLERKSRKLVRLKA